MSPEDGAPVESSPGIKDLSDEELDTIAGGAGAASSGVAPNVSFN